MKHFETGLKRGESTRCLVEVAVTSDQSRNFALTLFSEVWYNIILRFGIYCHDRRAALLNIIGATGTRACLKRCTLSANNKAAGSSWDFTFVAFYCLAAI